jgi:hypothetical protein
VNFLTLLPTMVVCIMVSASGYRQFLGLLDSVPGSNRSDEELVDDVLLALCIATLGILAIAGNFVDDKSSITWSAYPLGLFGLQHLMRDVLAISVFAVHMSSFEYSGRAWFKPTLLWFFVAITASFFPALVATVAHAANRLPAPTPSTIPSIARSIGPVMFGLRYGLTAVLFGLLPCLDAATLIFMTKPFVQNISMDLVLDDCFIDKIPSYYVYALAGARLASSLVLQLQGRLLMGTEAQPDLLNLLDSVAAFLLLLLVNYLLNNLYRLGVLLGSKIAQQAQADVRPDGVRKDYNLVGIVSFGVWVCLLGAIVLSGY